MAEKGTKLNRKSALYNLQAVLKETNLKPDMLRAWERRYGLPKPERTPGGHRLYSEYDIATIKWLRARQEEGLSISRAVELWKEISESGRDPLSGEMTPIGLEPLPAGVEPNRIDLLKSNWLAACLVFDALRAEDLINQAFGLYPVETVCFEILQKAIGEIGQLWYEGKVSVQQEHFATALAVRRIETLISATPRPSRRQTVLIGCPAGEWHSFPVLILTLLLRRKGFNVIYLGANTPLTQVEQTAAAIQPDLIVLSAQQLKAAAAVREAALLFDHTGIHLAYGGLIFNRIPELRSRIPALFLGEELRAAADRIEILLENPTAFPQNIPMEESGQEEARLYREKLPGIEAAVLNLLKEEGVTFERIQAVNAYLADEISAALELGDIRYLEADMAWLMVYFTDQKESAGLLRPYLAAYLKAVDMTMGEAGVSLKRWIKSFLAGI